jgi:two-component sensor histidine kinase
MNSGLGIIKNGAIHKLPYFDGKSCGQILSKGDNEFLVSVNKNGIYHFSYTEDSLKIIDHLTVQSGLSDNNIASMHIDSNNALWIGTDFGINKIKPEGEIEIFKVKESLERSKCFMNAIAETENAVYIGTFDGVIKVLKLTLSEEKFPPKTYIIGIDILNKDYDLEKVKMDTQLYNLPQGLELPYNANYISFAYEALYFSNPEEIEYSFMLEGLDENFSSPVGERTFTYPNLEPGKYTFLIRARSAESKWVDTPESFTFIIHPPFWERWWFRISALILVFGLIGSFVNYRITSIRKEEKEKSELNRRIAEFRLTALRAQMNPHFIFNALYSIQHFITTNEKEAAINYLAKFASLIRLILENSGNSEISIEEEVKMLELYLDLERLRFDQKFDFSIDVDDFINRDDTSIPYLMIQPFVENAIIHGIRNKEGKGHINIRFDLEGKDENFIKCVVEDDGIGREAAEKLKKPSPIKSQSLGLKVNRERLEILNPQKIRDTSVLIVDLKTDDNKPGGTRVEITIPVSTS